MDPCSVVSPCLWHAAVLLLLLLSLIAVFLCFSLGSFFFMLILCARLFPSSSQSMFSMTTVSLWSFVSLVSSLFETLPVLTVKKKKKKKRMTYLHVCSCSSDGVMAITLLFHLPLFLIRIPSCRRRGRCPPRQKANKVY